MPSYCRRICKFPLTTENVHRYKHMPLKLINFVVFFFICIGNRLRESVGKHEINYTNTIGKESLKSSTIIIILRTRAIFKS